MTAVLAMFARDAKIDLKLQLMVVPSVDLRWSIASEPARSASLTRYPSITEFAAMPWGPPGRMHWFMDHWIGLDQGQCPSLPQDVVCKEVLTCMPIAHRDAVAHDWIASPILAKSFEGLAPAHLVTAEFDLSRDETDVYGDMLKKAGVPVTSKRYLGVPHAFGHYNVRTLRSRYSIC
jgi:acetyl esterase/lipase